MRTTVYSGMRNIFDVSWGYKLISFQSELIFKFK